MTERGSGNLKGAFGNVRKGQNNEGRDTERGDGGKATGGTMPRRRRREKVGKRSRPEEYVQANGLVRRGVLQRWDRAKADPDVRQALADELSKHGIEFKSGDPDFGAVCELLLEEWLESVGYGNPGGSIDARERRY